MCNWGIDTPWEWGADVSNSWRTTGDIAATWNDMMHIFRRNDEHYMYAKPGAWNDADMLEIGNGM